MQSNVISVLCVAWHFFSAVICLELKLCLENSSDSARRKQVPTCAPYVYSDSTTALLEKDFFFTLFMTVGHPRLVTEFMRAHEVQRSVMLMLG